MPNRKLVALLADGNPHHITELAQALFCKPHQLNAIWQHTPAHIRGLLRQHDGFWRLVRPLALLPHDFSHPKFDITILPETSSSNDELLKMARSGQTIHKKIMVAEQQNQGRGRQGRQWHNRLGECLMFSLGWQLPQSQAQLGTLALTVALACREALVIHGCMAEIKWPNDLVIGLNKLGGVLIETLRQNGQTFAIIGIGINFVLPKNIEHAASIQTFSKNRTQAADFFTTLLNSLHRHLQLYAQQGFAPFATAYQHAHRDHLAPVCLWHEGVLKHEGIVTGIREDGALLLDTPTGNIAVSSGEISLRRPKQTPQLNPSTPRYLLLDGGNSRLKWTWVENNQIQTVYSAPYRDLSELGQQWQNAAPVHRIIGSAVCGTQKQALVAQQLPHQNIEWLGSTNRALGMFNHYRNPAEHGADRWFNALGSRSFTHNACVVVSCGTAVTIDAITADQHYLGGSIMPGFHLMKEALAQKTANLNRPDGFVYPFATTTNNAISSGMMDAVCGALILMHTRLAQRQPQMPTDVIITGGGASKVAAALPESFKQQNRIQVVDNLVLYGLLRQAQETI